MYDVRELQDLQDLQDLADRARQLADELFREPRCSRPGEGPSCITVEGGRALTRAEKARGWAARPFYAYNADSLCPACLAYWHAELAAQTLWQAYCCRRKEQATETRNTQGS